MKDILDFLTELDRNNNREWFDLNRKRYEELRNQFLHFTGELITGIREFDRELPLIKPGDCMFRIFRDVRFSNDKRPYKNNFGSFIALGGRKAGMGGYYIHLQPGGESFLAGGVYEPTPERLHAIRQEIYFQPETWSALISNGDFASIFTDPYTNPLKNNPKGYPAEWPHMELIKPRSYAWGHKLTDEEVMAPGFRSECLKRFQIIHPVNQFLNGAINENS